MAGKTLAGDQGRKAVADGLVEVMGHGVGFADGGTKAVFLRIEADVALVEAAIALEDPGLGMSAECPADGQGDSLFAMA